MSVLSFSACPALADIEFNRRTMVPASAGER